MGLKPGTLARQNPLPNSATTGVSSLMLCTWLCIMTGSTPESSMLRSTKKPRAAPAQCARAGPPHLEGKVVVLREGAQAHEGGSHGDACALHKLPQLGARVQAAAAHVQHRLACLHAACAGCQCCWLRGHIQDISAAGLHIKNAIDKIAGGVNGVAGV